MDPVQGVRPSSLRTLPPGDLASLTSSDGGLHKRLSVGADLKLIEHFR
jgi:hypothetical protein